MSKRIPQMAIDEVLARTDLVSLIDSYVPLKKKGVNFLACCPFHHEKTASFNVIPKKQFYYCFGCGASGNAISFLMQHKQLGFIDAVFELAQRLGLTLEQPENDGKIITKKSKDVYILLQEIKEFYRQCLKQYSTKTINYLNARGLSQQIIDIFELGYAPSDWHLLENKYKTQKQDLIMSGMVVQKEDGKTFDRYRNRLIFPIYDRQGRIVGFGGRVLEKNEEPKYMNSPETPLFHKGRELYGLYQLLQHRDYQGPIVVVEGYIDVISLVQHGIFYTVATLGTAITATHLQLLNKHTKEIIFCFDGDDAGRKAALRALEHSFSMMDGSLELKFMFLPDKEDPDSYIRKNGQAEFLKLMQQAKSFPEFWLDSLMAPMRIKTLSGKSQLLQDAISALNQIPEGSYKVLLIEQLARVSRVNLDEIQNLLIGKEVAKPQNIHITRSPLRLAIALIVQHPEDCLKKLTDLDIETGNEPSLELLKSLIVKLKGSPLATTAQLIEPWRNSSWFEPLQKLATWDHQVPENLVAQEFSDIIDFINKKNFTKEIDYYLHKLRSTGLTAEEKLYLQTLLQKKHQKAV